MYSRQQLIRGMVRSAIEGGSAWESNSTGGQVLRRPSNFMVVAAVVIAAYNSGFRDITHSEIEAVVLDVVNEMSHPSIY